MGELIDRLTLNETLREDSTSFDLAEWEANSDRWQLTPEETPDGAPDLLEPLYHMSPIMSVKQAVQEYLSWTPQDLGWSPSFLEWMDRLHAVWSKDNDYRAWKIMWVNDEPQWQERATINGSMCLLGGAELRAMFCQKLALMAIEVSRFLQDRQELSETDKAETERLAMLSQQLRAQSQLDSEAQTS